MICSFVFNETLTRFTNSRKDVIEMKLLDWGFDFDGVTVTTNSMKAYYIERCYGMKVPLHDCRKKILVGNGTLTSEQYNRVRDKIVATETGLWVDSMPGSLACIFRLMREGHSCKNITSRRRKGTEIARRWFEVRRFEIEVVGVGSSDKTEATKGLDAYVDNDLDKLSPLVGSVEHLYLFSDPCNEKEDERGIAKRVFSWDGIYKEHLIICSA
jgi:uncharacterized HAD superfamily protein